MDPLNVLHHWESFIGCIETKEGSMITVNKLIDCGPVAQTELRVSDHSEGSKVDITMSFDLGDMIMLIEDDRLHIKSTGINELQTLAGAFRVIADSLEFAVSLSDRQRSSFLYWKV
jgi:hypothetical protein